MLGRYFNVCNAIDNQNIMRQFYPALDKYWVIQSGYFILTTTVALGMGITEGKILSCHDILEEIEDNKLHQESTTTGRFMTASIIPFYIILVAQL